MENHDKFWFSVLLLGFAFLFLVGVVWGLPTTGAATGMSPGGVVMSASGVAAGAMYFEMGMNPHYLEVVFGNYTTPGGAVSETINGSPLYGTQTYYYLACDNTGCDNGAPQSFTLPAVAPLPTTTFSQAFSNITTSNFNILYIMSDLLSPLTWTVGATYGMTILIGLFEAFIFISIWRSGGSTRIPAIVAILTGVFMWGSGATLLGLGMPPEFTILGSGIFIVAIGGLILSFIKRG